MQKKTNRPKKRVSAGVVSEVTGSSKSMVRKVLRGLRNGDTDMGQTILIADTLLEEGMNKLVEEVKRVVKL